MIRATLAAVPSRPPVLWAKAIIFAAVTLVVTVPSALVAFLIGHSIRRARTCRPPSATLASFAPSSGRRSI